jgi:glycosyltransferase involved in cell wall biosynthesis
MTARLHLAIDVTALLPAATGVDVYMKQMVLHLAQIDRDNSYAVFLNREDRHLFEGRVPKNFVLRPLSFRARPARAFFQQVLLPAVARAERFDVIHSPAFLVPFLSSTPRHLLVVHDLTFFHMPEVHNRLHRSASFLWAVRKSMRKADLISVPSHATRAAILDVMPDLGPERIRIIPYGLDEAFQPAGPAETTALERLQLKEPYILFVGTLEPRKNVRLLVESYRRLAAAGAIDEHLVLAGRRGWEYDELERDLQAPELQGKVHRLGYVPAENLAGIYRGARLFVYPSRYEGFGFPPLEAMACGVPTIVTDTSSLSENLAGAAEIVPNGDAAALADAIRCLLSSPELHARRRAEGLARAARFRWQTTAAQTIECYRELARKPARY